MTTLATAPSFKLVSDAGKTVSLGDFAGKTLVLYFYPKDDTPGCTREAIAFSKRLAEFKKAGAEVVGVSKDTVATHCRFRDKYSLKVPLLSDADLTVHKAYGAYGEKTMYGKKVLGVIRSTFVISGGRIQKAFKSVKVDGHDEQVLAALRGIDASERHRTDIEAPPAKKKATGKTSKPAKKKK